MFVPLPIPISHSKESRLNYYRLNLSLTSVVTRYDVIITIRMIRSISVINFLFNPFFQGRYFLSSLNLEVILRTFRRNVGIYQNTGCSTRKEAIFLLTNMTKSNHLQIFVHVMLIGVCRIKWDSVKFPSIACRMSAQELYMFRITLETNPAYLAVHICISR